MNTPEKIATRHAVSRATVYRQLQIKRDLHNLQAQVETNNDATLEEHRQAWLETTGVTFHA
jgi:hypothetical protein